MFDNPKDALHGALSRVDEEVNTVASLACLCVIIYMHVYRYGPLVRYWCMQFESKQIISRISPIE